MMKKSKKMQGKMVMKPMMSEKEMVSMMSEKAKKYHKTKGK